MEPFYPNFVAGVYQSVDHRDSDTDSNDGAPPSRDSVLSDRSPTPPSFSPILSLQSREARNGDSISTVPWSPYASITVSGEPPAAFAVGASGDEDDDSTAPTVARLARLQVFESGEPGTATVHRSVLGSKARITTPSHPASLGNAGGKPNDAPREARCLPMTPPWRWTVALKPGNFARPNSRSSTKPTGPGRTTAATSTQSLGKPTSGGDSAPGTVPTNQRSPHPISPGLGTSAHAVPQTPGRMIAPSELGWEPDLNMFLSREEEDEVLQALRECPDAGKVMEEAQWIVAPVGWRPRRPDLGADFNPEWYSGTSVGTPDPRTPSATATPSRAHSSANRAGHVVTSHTTSGTRSMHSAATAPSAASPPPAALSTAQTQQRPAPYSATHVAIRCPQSGHTALHSAQRAPIERHQCPPRPTAVPSAASAPNAKPYERLPPSAIKQGNSSANRALTTPISAAARQSRHGKRPPPCSSGAPNDQRRRSPAALTERHPERQPQQRPPSGFRALSSVQRPSAAPIERR
nr:uncharacterized protein KIAA1522-like [Drosophila suzukii]